MTKEKLKQEAIERVDAFIDNFSQDVRSTLYDRLNQEDVKDFLYSLYFDSAEPREKRIAELETENEQIKNSDTLCKLIGEQKRKITELKNNNKVYCEGNGETLVVNVSFDNFTRINANHKMYYPHNNELEKENAELRKIAEFQQSNNMNTHLENKKLKEGLEVGSILNKGLNHLNKTLEEERDKYINMVFDKDEQLTKAKELLRELIDTPVFNQMGGELYETDRYTELVEEVERFLKETEE